MDVDIPHYIGNSLVLVYTIKLILSLIANMIFVTDEAFLPPWGVYFARLLASCLFLVCRWFGLWLDKGDSLRGINKYNKHSLVIQRSQTSISLLLCLKSYSKSQIKQPPLQRAICFVFGVRKMQLARSVCITAHICRPCVPTKDNTSLPESQLPAPDRMSVKLCHPLIQPLNGRFTSAFHSGKRSHKA